MGDQLSAPAGPDIRIAEKTADESVSSSTTLQDDDHLTVELKDAIYTFRAILIARTSSGNGYKIGWNVPGSATGQFAGWGIAPESGPTTDYGQGTIAGGVSLGDTMSMLETAQGTGNPGIIPVTGYIDATGNPGTFTMRWAQVTSGEDSSTLFEGSILQVLQV